MDHRKKADVLLFFVFVAYFFVLTRAAAAIRIISFGRSLELEASVLYSMKNCLTKKLYPVGARGARLGLEGRDRSHDSHDSDDMFKS